MNLFRIHHRIGSPSGYRVDSGHASVDVERYVLSSSRSVAFFLFFLRGLYAPIPVKVLCYRSGVVGDEQSRRIINGCERTALVIPPFTFLFRGEMDVSRVEDRGA